MIKLEIKGKIPAYFQTTAVKLQEVADFTIEKMAVEENCGLEIYFVTPQKIHQLNKRYRNVDRPTDILSFPLDPIPGNNGLRILGTIVICGTIAKERHEDITELIKHGILHLLGYDHETDLDAWDEVAQKVDCKF